MAKNRVSKSIIEAKQQAADYFGFSAGVTIRVGDEDFEIPNPGMMDDDQQERFDQLQHEMRTMYDREDPIEIPEQKLEDGTVIPARKIPGELVVPHCIDGKKLPPYYVRLARALFGDEGYERFRKHGGNSNLINLEWTRMNKEWADRLEADSKSDGSDSSLEGLPTGD